MIAGKVWGGTELIEANGALEFHRIEMNNHQFECLEDGIAFELYWAEFNHNDIKRETVGHG